LATYAIGDVQGCYSALRRLLDQLRFDPARDRLWLVGDLVNRGPQSLAGLRFVKSLGARAVTLLGNHDLHLLVVAAGHVKPHRGDTLAAILRAPDRDELLDWLRHRKMMHAGAGYAMVHAGLLPQWSIEKALALAREVEAALRGPRQREFLGELYGAEPRAWRDDLAGWDRLRVIVNAMARLRFCTPSGDMDVEVKGRDAPPGYRPWFELRPDGEATILCGHWSALGLKLTPKLAALDTGCVWGGSLSALRLEDRKLFQLPCRGYRKPGEA